MTCPESKDLDRPPVIITTWGAANKVRRGADKPVHAAYQETPCINFDRANDGKRSLASGTWTIGTFGPTDTDPQHFNFAQDGTLLPSFPVREGQMDKDTVLYTAVYDSVESAKSDLDALEQLHEDDLVGKFDAAVVDNENGKSHIVKRIDRPRARVIPEELGFGPLSRKELKEVGAELSGSKAALIMVGEPTLQKAFDKAVTRAAKIVKQTVDMTADELARELKSAVGS